MKFETGKEYKVSNIGTIRIEKRTSCYVTVSGMYTGRLLVRQWFGGGEFVMIPVAAGSVFCFSWGGGIAA